MQFEEYHQAKISDKTEKSVANLFNLEDDVGQNLGAVVRLSKVQPTLQRVLL